MPKPMEVLLVESHSGVGDTAQRRLEAAGHRVHRCYDGEESQFPCVGLTGAQPCPVDSRVDVALLVRRGVSPRPTPSEAGISCAIRAGVPVVEHGSDILDPYASWITSRSSDDIVAACEEAGGDAELVGHIRATIQPLLDRDGLDADDVTVLLERSPDLLVVHLAGSERVEPTTGHALGVRVLDVLRSTLRERYDAVKVQFHRP